MTMALLASVSANLVLDALEVGMGYIALHTASPGTTGVSENADAGSYARQACTWNAAAAGNKTNSSSLAFSTEGTTAVTHIGCWNNGTYGAGTYYMGAPLGAALTAASIVIAAGAIQFSAS